MANTGSKKLEKTVRLAECESIAVDMCPCGTLQLHLGALSLRFHVESVSRLVQTLGLALARRQAILLGADDPALFDTGWSHGEPRRGTA